MDTNRTLIMTVPPALSSLSEQPTLIKDRSDLIEQARELENKARQDAAASERPCLVLDKPWSEEPAPVVVQEPNGLITWKEGVVIVCIGAVMGVIAGLVPLFM